ncbi:hypothetical protein D3C73_1245350 [compost metagenome]
MGRMAGRLFEGPPRPEQPRHHVPIGHVVIAHGDEDRLGKGADPVAGRRELARIASLSDVAGNQDQIGPGGVGVVGCSGHRMFMLAPEMNVRKLEDQTH